MMMLNKGLVAGYQGLMIKKDGIAPSFLYKKLLPTAYCLMP